MQLLPKLYLTLLCLVTSSSLLHAQEEFASPENAAESIALPAPTISVDNPLESTPEFIELAWDSTEDAEGYYFELCLDNECDQLSYSTKTPDTTLSLENLKVQSYYWRVHTIDKAGNIGPASTPQPLIINPSQIKSADDPSSQQTQVEPSVTDRLDALLAFAKRLPWYVLLLIVAYAVYILRMLIWYLNK